MGFGQVSLPKTMFADFGNRSLCVSSWRLSVCGRKIPIWQNPREESGLYRTPKTDIWNQNNTKRKQMENQTVRFRYGATRNRLNESRKQKVWVKRRKKT